MLSKNKKTTTNYTHHVISMLFCPHIYYIAGNIIPYAVITETLKSQY